MPQVIQAVCQRVVNVVIGEVWHEEDQNRVVCSPGAPSVLNVAIRFPSVIRDKPEWLPGMILAGTVNDKCGPVGVSRTKPSDERLNGPRNRVRRRDRRTCQMMEKDKMPRIHQGLIFRSEIGVVKRSLLEPAHGVNLQPPIPALKPYTRRAVINRGSYTPNPH